MAQSKRKVNNQTSQYELLNWCFYVFHFGIFQYVRKISQLSLPIDHPVTGLTNFSSFSECSERLVLLLFNPIWWGSPFSGNFSLKHMTRSRWTPTTSVTTFPFTTSGRRPIQKMTGNRKKKFNFDEFPVTTDTSYSTSYIEQCNEDQKYCQVRLPLSAQYI